MPKDRFPVQVKYEIPKAELRLNNLSAIQRRIKPDSKIQKIENLAMAAL